MIVVDTSAMLALLNPADQHHEDARAILERIVRDGTDLATTNYVVSEAYSLVMRRLSMQVVQRASTFFGRSTLLFTTPLEHAAATHEFLTTGRSLSFVDCATFATMRARGLTAAFAFDADFDAAGFDLAQP